MPREYEACVRSNVAGGKPLKDAQRICAIAFFKRHGERPQDVESSYESSLFNILELLEDAKLHTHGKRKKKKKKKKKKRSRN